MLKRCISLLIIAFVQNAMGETVQDFSLLDAIRYGYQHSLEIKEQHIAAEIEELKYKIEELNMYTPNTSITMSNSINNTLAQRKSFSGTSSPTIPTEAQKAKMTNSNAVALEISDFKIFNSFIDYDKLKATKAFLQITRQSTFDNIRSYIFSIVSTYFELKTSKDLLENVNNKLSFFNSALEILELKRKSNPSAVSETDILFTKDQILQTTNEYNQAALNHKSLLLALNFLISADLDRNYNLTTSLIYKPLQTTLTSVLSNSNKTPAVIKSILTLNQAELIQKYTMKELLPLPKIIISGYKIGHSHNDGEYGYSGKVQQFTGNKGIANNFDLSIGVNWTIPLSGASGFFNELIYKNSYLNIERNKNSLTKTRFDSLNRFNSIYSRLKADEEQIKSMQERVKNSSLLLDEILKKSMKGKIDRKESEDAIGNATNANQSLLNAILSHFKQKVDLANTLGTFSILGESLF